MANMININSDDFVILANKLEKIGKADLPVAVRSTLTTLAVNVKGARGATTQRATIAKSAKDSFDYDRNKGLFKVMTGFTKAKTLEINKMESVAGIREKSGKDKLARGLAAHEAGKSIKSKATPLTGARRSKSRGGRVLRRLYIEKILEGAVDLRGKKKYAYNRGAHRAKKQNKHVIWGKKGGDAYLGKIDSSYKNGDSVEYDTTVLYRLNHSGRIKPKKENKYITRAGIIAMKDVDKIFAQQAKKRIDKSLRK